MPPLRTVLRRKVRRLLGRRVPIEQSWADEAARKTESVAFQSWFDTAHSLDEVRRQADRDWHYRFQSVLDRHGLKPRSACEIGFGGGRLLAVAARQMERVAGIDIHHAFERTDDYLRSEGARNFRLYRSGEQISETFDLFYSFIVIQHFASVAILTSYLDLIRKNGRFAVLYYAKNTRAGVHVVPELEFQKRECSLYIHPAEMERRCEGFSILEHVTDLPLNPETGEGKSEQARIVLRAP